MTRAEQSDADGILPVAIGTAIWTVALVVLLALRERLDEAGSTWWIGVTAVGVLCGAVGLVFLASRRRRHS